MSESAAKWTPGQRVCIVGHGTDRPLHTHHVVERLTALYVVTRKPGADSTRRHRLSDDRSPGPFGWGGSSIHAKCQRPQATRKDQS